MYDSVKSLLSDCKLCSAEQAFELTVSFRPVLLYEAFVVILERDDVKKYLALNQPILKTLIDECTFRLPYQLLLFCRSLESFKDSTFLNSWSQIKKPPYSNIKDKDQLQEMLEDKK